MTSTSTDPIASLLDRKVQEAKAEMHTQLNRAIWTGTPRRNEELRKCISDAVDLHMPEYAKKYEQEYPEARETYGLNALAHSALNSYKDQINKNIFQESPLLAAIKKEDTNVYEETNIAEAAVKKRKEAKAEELAEEIGDYLEGNDWESGDQITWEVSFHDTPDKTYHYVALRGGNHWFLTGRSGRYTHDQLLGILIDLGLRGTLVRGW